MPHTVIISELYDDGFEVLHSNWTTYNTNGGYIGNDYFSWESLNNQCRNAGSKGGFTIYRFGDVQPTGLKIDTTNFPDPALCEALKAKEAGDDWKPYGFDGNGYFSDEEISAVSKLYIENAGITNLDGIEIFYNLEELHCNNNSIKNLNLDLSKLPNLKIIGCSNSGLENLNLANAQNLQELYCSENKLSGTLNMGVFKSLQKFD